MGYRSDVTIRCEEKAFQMFKTAWEKADFKPHRILELGEDGNYTYILNWNWVKWYREFENEAEYNKTMQNRKYYLFDSNSVLMLENKAV